jgi:predicted DNA-binding transcriptional regulator YafY
MRADRLLSILLILQNEGRTTAGELARRLEVSERTIYRDLDALSTAGVPVYAERGPGGGCLLDEQYRTDLTGLNEAEVRALFFARSPAPLADLGLGKAMEAAILKLAATLPEAQRRAAERMRRSVYLDTAGWFQLEEPAPHLRTIQDALWQERRLRIFYRRADGAWVKRLVDPYGLVAKAGIWYMVAAMGRKIAVYRVSRIMEADLLEGRFERPAGFDLATYWRESSTSFEAGQSQYRVTLRIAPNSELALQRAFGDAIYSLLEQADPPDEHGWCRLTIPFQSMEQARTMALGLGALVEVVAPAGLRERVVEQAARVLAFYAQGRPQNGDE